jgi:hypothetical protein
LSAVEAGERDGGKVHVGLIGRRGIFQRIGKADGTKAVKVYTPGMTLKNAAFLAFLGMSLLTVICAVGFIGDVSALTAGAIAPVRVLTSLIHLLASLSVAVFLYVFHKTQ